MTHVNPRFITLFALAALAGACSKSSANEPVPVPVITLPPLPVAPVAAPAPAPVPEDSQAELLARKVARLAECSNRFGRSVRLGVSSYLGTNGTGSAPRRMTSRSASGLGFIGGKQAASRCGGQANAVAAQTPAHPAFDTAARAWGAALTALGTAEDDAKLYYERESFKDDGGARGRELHQTILTQWAAFQAADDELNVVVTAIQLAAAEERVAALANDPASRREFVVERSFVCGMKLLGLVQALEYQGRKLVAADAAGFATVTTDCERFASELAAEPSMQTPGSPNNYVTSSTQFMSAAIVVNRAVRDGQTFRSVSSADEVREEVYDAYNTLVDRYNGLR